DGHERSGEGGAEGPVQHPALRALARHGLQPAHAERGVPGRQRGLPHALPGRSRLHHGGGSKAKNGPGGPRRSADLPEGAGAPRRVPRGPGARGDDPGRAADEGAQHLRAGLRRVRLRGGGERGDLVRPDDAEADPAARSAEGGLGVCREDCRLQLVRLSLASAGAAVRNAMRWRPRTWSPAASIRIPAATIAAPMPKIRAALNTWWCQSSAGTDSNSAPTGIRTAATTTTIRKTRASGWRRIR